MQDKIYFPVNWVDGMKINKSHFIAQDNAFTFQLAQNTSCLLNELNYGLLPVRGSSLPTKIVISSDSQRKLQARILRCRAITAGGYYIEINEEAGVPGSNASNPVVSLPATLRELKAKGNQFYVVITINPFNRLPYGMSETPETPARIPHTVPTLVVDLVPITEMTRNILGPFQVPIGKMTIEDQRVMLEENYIPPCTSVSSHPELLEIQAGIEQFYAKMEVYALQIVQKIVQQKKSNDLSTIVQKLCENICMFTANQLTELRSVGTTHPPVQVVIKVAALARLMKNTIDAFTGGGKDELVTYFTQWSNVKQGELEGAIVNLANHQYDHIDINESIDKVAVFTKLISKLFHQLSRVEYIGKPRESGIFVNETTRQEAAPAKRSSFLAE